MSVIRSVARTATAPARASHGVLRRPRESDLGLGFAILLGVLLTLATLDAATTDFVLSRGGYETVGQTASMQLSLGLPLWTIVWIILHAALVTIATIFWRGSLWLEGVYRWLLWPARIWRVALVLGALYWDIHATANILHNLSLVLSLVARILGLL